MKLGERHRCLTKDNYGGRKGHRAPEVGLNVWRRGRIVIVFNDARGCYDRIAHTVLQLAMLRLGVPHPPLQSMVETIQEMDHHICTALVRLSNQMDTIRHRHPTRERGRSCWMVCDQLSPD
jgi:hypothetical protein